MKTAEPPNHGRCINKPDFKWIRSIHHWSGHPGIKWTLYFVRQVDPTISKVLMRAVIGKCQSIDPPPMCWTKGKLDVSSDTWYQVGMDITHYQAKHYLSLVDCASTQFSVWCHPRQQVSSTTWKLYSTSISHQLKCLLTMTQQALQVLPEQMGSSTAARDLCMSLPLMGSQDGVIRV